MTAEVIQAVTFWSVIALTIAYLAVVQLLFRRLEAQHLPTFDQLGRPHLFKNNKLHHSGSLLRFLLSPGHSLLGDPVVTRQVQTIRLLMLLILTFFAALLVNFFRLPTLPR